MKMLRFIAAAWALTIPAAACSAQTAPNQGLIEYVLAVPCLNPDGVEVKLWLNADPPPGTKVQLVVGKHRAQIAYGQRLFLPLPGEKRWTPDTPNMLTLEVSLGSERRKVRFGLRRVEAKGEKLFLNGEPFYVRGFGCDGNGDGQLRRQVTTPAGFRNYVARAKQFGFNTMRSHMPENDRPQAFLDACDEMGLCFWAEFPMESPDLDKLAYFWNHPSVIWWCWGNEIHGIGGGVPWAKTAYEFAHQMDPSRMVMDNSGWGEYDRPTTDLFSQHMGYYFPYGPRAQCFSSYALFTAEGSMLGKPMEQVMQEMRDGKFRLGKPLLAHETGNYGIFPDIIRRAARMNFSQRPQIVARMKTGNRLAHLKQWIEGSTKFKQQMDKVWMEQARKSPIIEGYEMWMLADHGYAFSGVIEDGEDCKIKPFISPEHYRTFNSADALLADFPDNNFKRIFAPGEKVKLRLLASVYGKSEIKAGKAIWSLLKDEKILTSGGAMVGAAGRGRVSVLGDIAVRMPSVKSATALDLRVKLANGLSNRWHVWVFPPVDAKKPGNVTVVKQLDDATIDALGRGARVFLQLEDVKSISRDDQAFCSVLAKFKPAQWVYGHNLGAYIPKHPAFAGFPNAGFSDLQFYRAIDHGRKIVLNDCPFAPLPIVDAIDLPIHARKATYLFELAVGKGKLLVSGFNFSDANRDYPEVRVLAKSLLDYASGPLFAPKTRVDVETFRSYVHAKKANPIVGDEGWWDACFYGETDTASWNKFLDAGEEPPVVKATPYKPTK